MALDPILDPNLYAEIRDLQKRVAFLERAPRLASQTFASVRLGTVHDGGYSGTTSASFTPVFVAAGPASAFLFTYDIKAAVFGSPSPADVSWRILAGFDDAIPTLLDFDTLLPGDRSFGTIDMLSGLGVDAAAGLGHILKVSLEVASDGLGGEAAVRLNTPFALRVAEV